MAGFEGIQWAPTQMRFILKDKKFDLLPSDSKVYAVSRSIHYGMFLAFEGIRFFCKKKNNGNLELVFLNLEKNLERFRKGISFNLGNAQQYLVPSVRELEYMFIEKFLAAEGMKDFLIKMADDGAQGYLRPFTIDEDQSIGVTFPENPSIRAVAARYDAYLGEPFSGVVIPDMVRAIGINGTGCLKLGINYLMSIKAVDAAKEIDKNAASALFLDDRTHLPLRERMVTEWDTSCCLIALSDNTVIKIPESNLILPSVTIRGIVNILKQMGVNVEERDFSYGELLERAKNDEIAAICSIGTAGILNRCSKLLLTDENRNIMDSITADKKHYIFEKLGRAKEYYWQIYTGEKPVPEGIERNTYTICLV